MLPEVGVPCGLAGSKRNLWRKILHPGSLILLTSRKVKSFVTHIQVVDKTIFMKAGLLGFIVAVTSLMV